MGLCPAYSSADGSAGLQGQRPGGTGPVHSEEHQSLVRMFTC